MAFIEGKCKSCGAPITFDDSLSNGICEYCHTKFIKEDIVINNNYNFKDATVIINDENSIDNKLKSAEAYLTKLDDYEKAKIIYKSITEINANDYRGWWGLVQVLTKQFTYIECKKSDFDEIEKYAKNAFSVASEEQRKVLNAEWISYSQKARAYIDKTLADEKELISIQEKKINRQKRNKFVRTIISVTLSLICNIFLIISAFVIDISSISSTEIGSLITVLIILGINTIITTVLGLIGSTKICSCFPAITSAVCLGVIIYQMLSDTNAEIFAMIISLIVLCIIALIIVTIYFTIPTFILKKFVNDKENKI